MRNTCLIRTLMLLVILVSALPFTWYVSAIGVSSLSNMEASQEVAPKNLASPESSSSLEELSQKQSLTQLADEKALMFKRVFERVSDSWLSLEDVVSTHKPDELITVIVEFKDSIPQSDMVSRISASGISTNIRHVFKFIPAVSLEVPAGQVLGLKSIPGVKTVWTDIRLSLIHI